MSRHEHPLPHHSVDATQHPEYLRRQRAVLRMTPQRWRRVLRPLGKTSLVAVPLLGLLFWLLSSPMFALASVRLEGLERAERGSIFRWLEPLRGRNLPSLAMADVEEALLQEQWIQQVSLRKRLPNSLVVEIVEYDPVAVLERRDEGLVFVGADGTLIAPAPPATDLLRLRLTQAVERDVASGSAALEDLLAQAIVLVREARLHGFEWAVGAEEVTVLDRNEVELASATAPCPVRFGLVDLPIKGRVLERFLEEITERFEPAAIDLRFGGRIVLETADAVSSSSLAREEG